MTNKDTWTCTVCTLINPSSIHYCEACSNPSSKRRQFPIQTFLNGSCKLTYCQPFPKGNTISFQDICMKSKLLKCFVSAFCIDLEWLFSQLPTDIPVIIATHGQGKREAHEYRRLPDSNIIILPKSNGYGVMHIKLFVFWYSDFVRVVVSSANLIPYDWNTMENIVWFQDFLKIPIIQDSKKTESLFEKDLKLILKELGAPVELITNLNQYNFSNACAQLVYSLPYQENLSENGHLKLKKCVNQFYKTPDMSNRHFVYQTSSLGSLSPSWIREFHASMNGQETIVLSKKEKDAIKDYPPFQIIYPSKKTVHSCTNQVQPGGTLFFNERYWNAFPKQCLRDCISHRATVLMHSKILLCYPESNPPSIVMDIDKNENYLSAFTGNTKSDGFIYIGSHNSTFSAWGTVNKSKQGDLQCKTNNWECGVVLPIALTGSTSSSTSTKESIEIPIPFEFPSPSYSNSDEPWFH